MDVSGTVCAAARMDGSRTITYAIALAKANTAREFQTPTDELAAGSSPRTRSRSASWPARSRSSEAARRSWARGRSIGAIGTSGGSEDQDVECAERALAAVRA